MASDPVLVPCALCWHFDKERRQAWGWVQSIDLAKGERGFSLCAEHMEMMVRRLTTKERIRSVLKPSS